MIPYARQVLTFKSLESRTDHRPEPGQTKRFLFHMFKRRPSVLQSSSRRVHRRTSRANSTTQWLVLFAWYERIIKSLSVLLCWMGLT